MTLVLNHLNNPLQILGVKVTSLALIVGSLAIGAALHGFSLAIGLLLVNLQIKKLLKRRKKYAFIRLLYKSLPTRSPIWDKTLQTMPASYKQEFIK